MQYLDEMKQFQDDTYRSIIQPTIKEGLPLFGVRAMDIKEIAKHSDISTLFQDIEKDQFFEQRMIRLHLLARAKMSEGERISLIDSILPYIDSWALNDSFCSALKGAKKEPDLYLSYIIKQSKESFSYRVRFALVMLNTYYHSLHHLEKSLPIIESIHREEKEVVVAKAWVIVTMLSHNPIEVLSWYEDIGIEEKVHRLVVRKARESRLVKESTVEKLKTKKAFIS